ncbi:MAG: CRTAC1 family protein [Gammaproteobacteria bacterium]|nr:CRTAC1 family protein [Gammaproteobacteria bacterium]
MLWSVVSLWGCSASLDQSENEPRIDVWFVEESELRGIDFVHQSGHRIKHLLPEITGSGVALTDVNGDGLLDIYLIQSGSLLDEDRANIGANQLYLNIGEGNFELQEESGLADYGYGMGVAAGDYDNDGDNDFFVTNVGENRMFRNDGSGSFTDVTNETGLGDNLWGTSAAFLDLDKDGDLDLYHANYLHWTLEIELPCFGSGVETYCPPNNYQSPAIDRIFRNNGDGTFTDVTRNAGITTAFGNGFGVIGADYDDNGYVDVFVANDLTVNQLWMNQGDFRFLNEAMSRGSGVDGFGTIKAGMGVASADPDQDGDFDILVVNLTGESDSFFRNEGTHFTDSTSEIGLSAPSRRYTRFGVVMADFDNDGWLDIYEANGGVSPVDLGAEDIYAEPNSLYRGLENGRLEEVFPLGGTVQSLVHTSRGLGIGDLDNDGGLDLVVVNRDAKAYVLMNRFSSRGNWIAFSVLSEHESDAIGAVVSLVRDGRRVYGSVQPEGSYLSSNDPRVHFGLGAAARVEDVTVLWPSGEVETFGDFASGGYEVLKMGNGTPSEWTR